MKLLVCSSPDPIQHEQDLVKVLFEEGLECFHLRKPNYSEDEIKTWLEPIDASMRKHIVIHNHWKLEKEYGLKGVHMGSQTMQRLSKKEIINWMQVHPNSISTSVHNMYEAVHIPNNLTYVWLSPIFESISKANYKSNLTNLELDFVKQFLQKNKKTKVYALGGISSKHITELKQRNFDGIVVLGTLWNNIEGIQDLPTLVKRFYDLHKACNTNPTH